MTSKGESLLNSLFPFGKLAKQAGRTFYTNKAIVSNEGSPILWLIMTNVGKSYEAVEVRNL